MKRFALGLVLAVAAGCGGGPSPKQEAAEPGLGPLLMEGDTAFNGGLQVAEAKLGAGSFAIRLRNTGTRALKLRFYVRYTGPKRVLIDAASDLHSVQLRPGQEASIVGPCEFAEATGVAIRLLR